MVVINLSVSTTDVIVDGKVRCTNLDCLPPYVCSMFQPVLMQGMIRTWAFLSIGEPCGFE